MDVIEDIDDVQDVYEQNELLKMNCNNLKHKLFN